MHFKNCQNVYHAMKCIEVSSDYPHLINTPLNLSDGITPFHRVCFQGNEALIDFMLAKGKLLNKTIIFNLYFYI